MNEASPNAQFTVRVEKTVHFILFARYRAERFGDLKLSVTNRPLGPLDGTHVSYVAVDGGFEVTKHWWLTSEQALASCTPREAGSGCMFAFEAVIGLESAPWFEGDAPRPVVVDEWRLSFEPTSIHTSPPSAELLPSGPTPAP